MNVLDDKLEELIKIVEEREKRTRMRSFLYSLLPILVAGVSVFFAIKHVASLEKRASDLTVKVSGYEQQVSQLQKRVDTLNGQARNLNAQLRDLRSVTDYSNYKVDFNILDVMKSRRISDSARKLLISITRNQNVKFKINGTLPNEGFDSPGFAAYILKQNKLLNVDPSATVDLLMKKLPVSDTSSQNGDIVFYKSGYAMFYFRDLQGQGDFVIGMTPLGVLSLKPNFASPVGRGQVLRGERASF